MLLPRTGAVPPDAELTCRFEIVEQTLSIAVSVPLAVAGTVPGTQSFAWQVLSALAGDVSAESRGGYVTIRLTKRRGARS